VHSWECAKRKGGAVVGGGIERVRVTELGGDRLRQSQQGSWIWLQVHRKRYIRGGPLL